MIYLDYAANTPADPEALSAFALYENKYIANPNSAHPLGSLARQAMADVTDRIASLLGIEAGGIIYTSGASEANNMAIKGIARARQHVGKHIISTPLEHPSVSGPLMWLKEQGWEIDLADIGRDGRIDVSRLKELIRSDTVLVAVAAVDSELGQIQPVDEIIRLKAQYPGLLLHVDATQAIGKLPFSFAGIDSASFTAHKFYGLNGIGVLYKANNVLIEPLIHGGFGASVYRSGTPTLSLAASLEKALSKSMDALPERYAHVRMLNERLRISFAGYPDVRINSQRDGVPHILNLSVTGVKGTRFRDALGEGGACVSVKSACSSDGTPSKAVFAVSRDKKTALSSWRISLSHLTTQEEIKEFLEIFDSSYRRLKGV